MALCVVPLAAMASIGDGSPLSLRVPAKPVGFVGWVSSRLGPYRLLETVIMGAYARVYKLSDDAGSQSHVDSGMRHRAAGVVAAPASGGASVAML